jgi:hypothetical protein
VRRFNAILTLVWLGPGFLVSLYLKDSVPWVVGMSWYAIVASHLAAWRADVPNHDEQ